MTKHKLRILPAVAAAIISFLALPGCFTGIEGTEKIKYSKSDRVDTKLSSEEALLIPAKPCPPNQWQTGKQFIMTEGRIGLAFSPSYFVEKLIPGDTIYFQSLSPSLSLAGDSVTDIIFLNKFGNQITYQVDASISNILGSEHLYIPFTIDAEVISTARQILKGRDLWTLRPISSGKRYSKVTVTDVTPGSSEYPISVILDSGDSIMILIEGRNSTSRIFSNFFSLTDPRKRYPNISDINWTAICNGTVTLGMTREECRLALGSPTSVDRITAYNGLIERWIYENGIYLNFLDGILTSFRE